MQINGVEIKRVTSHKYLGKIIEEKPKDKEEIKERIKKAKDKTNESMRIINNNNLNRKRIDIGNKLLQAVVIPTLIYGAETWCKLTVKETQQINSVQTQYLARMLKVPKTTPRSALLAASQSMKTEHMANQRKLLYYIELNNREEKCLEVKMKNIQECRSYGQEIIELKEKYSINENLKEIDMKECKMIVKNAVRRKNESEIQEELNNGKKTKNMTKQCTKYLNKLEFDEARTIFKAESGMLNLKANYKQKYPYGLQCDSCKKK